MHRKSSTYYSCARPLSVGCVKKTSTFFDLGVHFFTPATSVYIHTEMTEPRCHFLLPGATFCTMDIMRVLSEPC